MREPPEFAAPDETQLLFDAIRGPDVHGVVREFKTGDRVMFHLPDGTKGEDTIVGCFVQPAVFEGDGYYGSEDIPSCVLSKHTWAPTVNLEVLDGAP